MDACRSATSGTGVTSSVAIANFGSTPAEVEVSVLFPGEGVLAPETVDVPSRSVVHVDVGARVPAGTAYSVVVTGAGRNAGGGRGVAVVRDGIGSLVQPRPGSAGAGAAVGVRRAARSERVVRGHGREPRDPADHRGAAGLHRW